MLQILLVTTGIGYMAAVACVQDMLSQCGPLIKDIIYTGKLLCGSVQSAQRRHDALPGCPVTQW